MFPYPIRIGIIGGGQLGRMLILECRRMDYYTAVLDPDLHGPAAQVADSAFHPYDVRDFIKDCDIAACEFEHVDIDVVKAVEGSIKVYPSSPVLEIKQSRAAEKTYLSKNGFPVSDFWILDDGSGLQPLIEKNPIVVKTSKGGYDGKGLYIIKTLSDYDNIRDRLNTEIVAEKFVPFIKEVSVICARNEKGNVVCYPVVENVHDRGILLYTIAPADISERARRRSSEIASDLAKSLDITGLLCVEIFLLENDEILINEFAPRPHNSGHYTMDSCDISQFEMLLRAICGLPMTEPELLRPSAMLNILGRGKKDIDIYKILALPGVNIHLYGKRDARERRKMGHINILGKTMEDVRKKLNYIKNVVYTEKDN